LSLKKTQEKKDITKKKEKKNPKAGLKMKKFGEAKK
jgi:hypothetical protein